MTSTTGRLADYLTHIVDAINRIERYVDDLDELAFMHSELVQDAVIRNIEIVGEASRNIERRYPEFAAEHPDLPLAVAYQMRNAVSHGYFKVDIAVVWSTVQNALPDFKAQVQVLRDELHRL